MSSWTGTRSWWRCQDQPPTNMNRFAAITQLAVFEAVNTVTGEYRPYLGTSTPAGLHRPTQRRCCGPRVLRHYFPDRAAVLDDARARSLGQNSRWACKAGTGSASERCRCPIDRCACKRRRGSARVIPAPFVEPGEWQLTPDCPPQGVLPPLAQGPPFAIRRADQFRSEPPPALKQPVHPGLQGGQERRGRDSKQRPEGPRERRAAIRGSGRRRPWNPLPAQLAAARRSSLSQNAANLALLNMALSDAGVAVMDTKYHYNFWRPETAIPGRAMGTTEPTRILVCALHHCAVFPQLPVRTREHELRGSRGTRAHLRPAEVTPCVVDARPCPDVVRNTRRLKEITSDIDDARSTAAFISASTRRGAPSRDIRWAPTCMRIGCGLGAIAHATTHATENSAATPRLLWASQLAQLVAWSLTIA